MTDERSAPENWPDSGILPVRALQAKSEWEQTVDCLPLPIMLVDHDGAIRRVNRLLADYSGQPVSALIGIHWETACRAAGFGLRECCAPGDEVQHLPSGRWFVVGCHELGDECAGMPRSHVIILDDVTDHKCACEELARTCASLKSSRSQLIQQEKMASIGQIAAGVAHEINNPMGFIASNLNTLKRYASRLGEFIGIQQRCLNGECASHEVDEAMHQLKIEPIISDLPALIDESLDGAERVRRIVADLKGFSRTDQGEPVLADLNECLETTLNIVGSELKYKATVIREFGDIPKIFCHPQQLNQVFVNLLINAVQAMEQRGEIRIRTEALVDGVVIAISDTGTGMTREVQARIFEPFFTTKPAGLGTGLGVSISADIVRNHGGTIAVESEPGRGTTFTIMLPVDIRPQTL